VADPPSPGAPLPPAAALSANSARAGGAAAAPLLEARGIRKVFSAGGLVRRRRIAALEDVSFAVRRGEAVAIVGESGSGKSTIARVLLRLVAPDAGELRIDGADVLASEPRRASLAYRARVQMVFQDPFGSLNPVHSVGHHLARPLLRHGRASRDDVRGRVLDLLRTVGLEPAEELVGRHPHQLSGGQRQRVAIARALAVEPDVLVADEPTSMLDVSIRSGVLALLARLKRERGLSIVLITHDLAAARLLADRILVLYRGRIVEDGPAASLVDAPAHPYTRALVASASHAAPIEAAAPGPPAAAPEGRGCPFAPRCPDVLERCRAEDPAPRTLADGRRVRCHLHPQGDVAVRPAAAPPRDG
jgi:oligopeptide/dipeptide ABC transporter ATP-binding protein